VDRTNAERQRRYMAKLKSAATQAHAQDSTGLLQENTALRRKVTALERKVTVLEQELAQQRAMAKRFLGNRAAGVPSGKIERVSGRGIALHFPTARPWPPPDPAPRLLIPKWVPERARQAIKKEWKFAFLNENVREALKRLATDRRMRKVWEKLSDPDGIGLAEYLIIPAAVYALGSFPLRRQKPRSRNRADKNRADWETYEEHWVKYRYSPGYDWPTCANWACILRDVLKKMRDALAPTSDEMWSPHWRGDPAMNTTGAAISFLDDLFRCFLSIDEERRSPFADLKLPKIARWNNKAQQRFFCKVMSDQLYMLCDDYYDHVVDTLIAVAFDLPVGPGRKKVYEWRRRR
jgi:hypothetical protein